MQIPVLSKDGTVVAQIDIESDVHSGAYNSGLVHEIATMQFAGIRSGNASTKTRGEVSGGGKKPYRQKGTGRARQGSSRAPQWRGGAIIFGPRPRNYFYKEPSKKVLKALKESLLVRISENELRVIPSPEVALPKTKILISMLSQYGANPGYKRILLISENISYETLLAGRNIPGLMMLSPQQLTPLDVVLSDSILIGEDSQPWIEHFLKGAN
jgi:large subunit ribosomal protein L4